MSADSAASDDNLRAMAEEAYDRILQTANRLMHLCKHVRIEILAKETDPSLEEIANAAETLSKIIGPVMDDIDPMMGQKANDYTAILRDIAVAVRNHDTLQLSNLVTSLEEKPGI